jgi:hypothetical protein
MAVEIRKMGADAAQVDEPVDGSKQVASGDVILKREFVKQRRLRFLLWSHHRPIPQSIKELNHRSTLQSSKSFSTKSALFPLSLRRVGTAGFAYRKGQIPIEATPR